MRKHPIEYMHGDIRVAEEIAARKARPQPTASVDAEQVWREDWDAVLNQPHGIPGDEASVQAATAVIQSYGDARADAARRETVDAARSAVFAVLRKHDVDEQMFAEIAAATHALKENPNAG